MLNILFQSIKFIYPGGLDLVYLQKGISGDGYFGTTQKYFATEGKRPKILSKKQKLKNTLIRHDSFNKI